MTRAELERLWAAAPAEPARRPRLPGPLQVAALDLIGLAVSPAAIERARFELQVLRDGDAIDVGEYVHALLELDRIQDAP
jgi:hypothetical protein